MSFEQRLRKDANTTHLFASCDRVDVCMYRYVTRSEHRIVAVLFSWCFVDPLSPKGEGVSAAVRLNASLCVFCYLPVLNAIRGCSDLRCQKNCFHKSLNS